MSERNSVVVLNRFSGHLMQFISMLRKNHLGKLSSLGPGSAFREKGEKIQGELQCVYKVREITKT